MEIIIIVACAIGAIVITVGLFALAIAVWRSMHKNGHDK